MIGELTAEQLDSVKKSYFNILGLFLEQEKIESRYLRCLLKWGFELHLNPNDLRKISVDVGTLGFTEPEERIHKLESIYHLVYMIYLDKVVEDVELEVATIYSEKLGFPSYVVSELFKSIATEAYDEDKPWDAHHEIMEFLKIHNPL